MIAETLSFVLEWIDDVAGEPVRTMARFYVNADGETVWPSRGASSEGLEIYADDLLSHLIEFWQPLVLRQNYPLPLDLDRPSQLRPEAEKAWGALPEEQVERQEDLVSAFEEAHNIGLCFAGQFDLPRLWLFRQGQNFLVETDGLLIWTGFATTVAELSRIGDLISERLHQANDGQWARLVRRWRERDSGNPELLLMWSTGQPRESATELLRSGVLESVSSVAAVANDDNELRIAARMTGALPVMEIARLLRWAAQIPPRATPELDELSREAVTLLNSEIRDQKPFEQGVALARFVRNSLGLGERDRVDPLPMFFYKNYIFIKFEDMDLANLDAIAIWGPSHGPGVLVNKSSRRLALGRQEKVAGSGAARVTLAHELCHLLVDREHALGAVEILNGRMPLMVEQRARAFAAAFMLPSEAAAQMWRDVSPERTQDGIRSLLKRLTQRFGVTTSIAAWQLEHGAGDEDPILRFLLGQIAPQR